MFDYSRRTLENCIIYEMKGSLTMGMQSQEFGANLKTLDDVACPRVVLDFENLKSIDSSGFGVLIIWKKIVENINGVVAIAVPDGSLVGRAFSSFCMDKIFPIFPEREKAIGYLKNRHMGVLALQKMLLRVVSRSRSSQEDLIISEMRSLFAVYPEALRFLEKGMLDICAKSSSPLLARAQLNRLILLLGKLPDQYEANKAQMEGSVLIIGNESSAGFAQLAESLLAWLGLQAHNATACDLWGDSISEAINAIEPTHLALCMGCEKDWGKLIRAAKSLETMQLMPKMICYAPVAMPGQEPLSAKMTLCSEISGMAALLPNFDIALLILTKFQPLIGPKFNILNRCLFIIFKIVTNGLHFSLDGKT
ncbi:MAG: STAS domain-containing protein, partial [Candidatus Sumerlaeota bacterium]|nr:STAS domain-containing protein [Candidatus Sumerlaeota bacterium]